MGVAGGGEGRSEGEPIGSSWNAGEGVLLALRRLEHEMTRLYVAIYKVRPPTDAERWNGMARRAMTDAAYARKLFGDRS